MYLVAGLGNPGREYAHTRHNLGFRMVDLLALRLKVEIAKPLFKAVIGRGLISEKTIILAKPQTYMNLSGNAVVDLLGWFKIPAERLLVAFDDVDLPLGSIRVKPQGGHGGHRGMMSIIEKLGTREFHRIRIGVGKPQNSDYEIADWVLGRLSEEEEILAKQALEKAVEAAMSVINEGSEAAMNKFNRQ